MTTTIRKKLIEVSIPLEAINAASAREKSIRHGHPSTLHLWWARRPLAACRAVLFAQLVDDPSSWPERFDHDEEKIAAERRRLHKVIEAMVPWAASNDAATIGAARYEIARSVAWGRGEEPPSPNEPENVLSYLQTYAPPVYDPFCGGGSIPLEAQRLGLRAYGSDLNPVAVLISKALVEIPPKFAGRPPVNPEAQAELKRGGSWNGKGAQGLAEDVRYYGRWMRDEAERRIGHLYPKAKLPDGSEATVIAWLWARTVRSPDPAAKGAMVPLVSSFMLSTKEDRKAWVEPVIDASAPDGWRFEVRTGTLAKADEERLRKGTKTARGNFACLLTGVPIPEKWNRSEGKAQRLSARLMAIVAEGQRQRVYLPPSAEHEQMAKAAKPAWEPEGELYEKALGFRVPAYGLTRWADLFTPRQLAALTTFSDLVTEARAKVLADSSTADFSNDVTPLHEGGIGAVAYADAVATYLAFTNSRMADRHSSLTRWDPNPTGFAPKIANTFSRPALPMVWDHTEGNPFSTSSGNLEDAIGWVAKNIDVLGASANGIIYDNDAIKNSFLSQTFLFSMDPPYYDNIGYADLSDFFYIWLRRSLSGIWPNLFRRLTTPKAEELVATPYRHGGRDEAEAFFMSGMGEALRAMRNASTDDEPLAVYYAYKQSEIAQEGIFSAGWTSFLQAVIGAGLVVDGTWPMRTELPNRMRGLGSNALASSIVLVCRKRFADASVTTRAEFIRALKREMPDAIDAIRKAGVGPVDMQQSVIGPGMGVFSRHAKVLEDDDSAMSVRTALALINRVWEELEGEIDAQLDAVTQVALAWFASYGFDARSSGELITLTTAKNTSDRALFASGVFKDLRGRACLTPREELPPGWTPTGDKSPTVWECVQHTAHALAAEDGGAAAAARLVAQMGARSAEARALAYRLFQIATDKKWAAEALVYNELAEEWPKLEDLAGGIDPHATVVLDGQGQLSFEGSAA